MTQSPQSMHDRINAIVAIAAKHRAENPDLPQFNEAPSYCRLNSTWPKRHVAALPDMKGPALEKAKSMRSAASDGKMVLLCGDRGRGKTQIATWLARERGKAGQPTGIYIRAHDLFALIKRAWLPGNKAETEWETLKKFKTTPFLVIDELHERSESDWENRTLTNILDCRYADMLPTLLLSNLRQDQLTASLGASIVDRVAETGGLVTCDWESYRG